MHEHFYTFFVLSHFIFIRYFLEEKKRQRYAICDFIPHKHMNRGEKQQQTFQKKCNKWNEWKRTGRKKWKENGIVETM